MKKEKCWNIVIGVITFLSFFLINNNVIYFGDDYYFLSFAKCNLSQYILKLVTHYKLDNGRIIVHMLDTICLKFPIVVWSVINSLMLTGICYLVSKIASNDNSQKMRVNFSIIFALIALLDIAVTNQSVYWITGSFNYVYPIFMLLVYWNFLNKIDFGKKYFILAIIFGFLASASVEQVGMMAFGLTLLTLFAKMEGINKFFNKNKKLLVLLFVTLVGLLTVILAPSQLIRLNSNPEIDTLERIENNLYFITYEFTGTKAILPYVLLFNLAIFIYSLTEKEKNRMNIFVCIFSFINLIVNLYLIKTGTYTWLTLKNIVIITIIFITYLFNIIWFGIKTEKNFFSKPVITAILLGGSQIMMIISPIIGGRNLLAGLFMFMLLICLVIDKIDLKATQAYIITAVLIIFGILLSLNTAGKYYENKLVEEKNIQVINEERNNSNNIIVLKKPKNSDYCWSLPCNSTFHEMWYKEHYGIVSELCWEE